jgi:hypothetical protein
MRFSNLILNLVEVEREILSKCLVFKCFRVQVFLHVIHVIRSRFNKILKLGLKISSQILNLSFQKFSVAHQACAILLLNNREKEVDPERCVLVQSLPQGFRFAFAQSKPAANLFKAEICDSIHIG